MTKSPVVKSSAFSKDDLAAVLDNPEWTDATTDRSRSFGETFPDLVPRTDVSGKMEITLLLDQRVIDHFKQTGEGWQMRLNDALVKAAGL